MRTYLGAVALLLLSAAPALASSNSQCSGSGDFVISARTPQVDLYSDSAATQKAMTMDEDKFPSCTPIVGRAPNMMVQVQISGTKYWVEPHMVKTTFTGKMQPICRNLAMGSNQQKVGATRGLGEGCPKPGASQ
jgi:hypothetical protein